MSPCFVKQRECIGGKGVHGVVRTVEQESGAACNGTEFPDDKPVLIDWIMVKHIIPLKIPWVMDKIIINCKFLFLYWDSQLHSSNIQSAYLPFWDKSCCCLE